MSKRLAKDVANVVFVRFQQRSNRQRWMSSKLRYHLARGACMEHGFGGLFFKPFHDREAAIAVHHERIMGVMNGPGQLHLKDTIESTDHLFVRSICHKKSPGR